MMSGGLSILCRPGCGPNAAVAMAVPPCFTCP